MSPIMLARVAYVLAFTDVLRRLGAPVDRELSRAGLPTLLEDQPDAYIPVLPALVFLQRMERSEGVEDLGFLAAQAKIYANLRRDFITASHSAPTLYARLQLFQRLVGYENTHCRVSLMTEGNDIRIAADLVGYPCLEGLRYSEWIQLIVLIEIVRNTAGSQWWPAEITFQSHFLPCRSALERFPNTRFLFGQKHTSIKTPLWLLYQSPYIFHNRQISSSALASVPQLPAETGLDFPGSLKLALRAYLRECQLNVYLAAEIAGVSVRTLQRRLAQSGLSYSTLLEQARFEAAIDLLKDTGIKSLDVAYALGYDDPSHFSRAFRRIAERESPRIPATAPD
ncbi:MAG: helix-turn-helix domain-containing protein [Candidatus Competibacteraceae bacterium]